MTDLATASIPELIAEVRRRCRRRPGRGVVRLGDLALDLGTSRAVWGDLAVGMTAREAEVLCALMASQPGGVTAMELGALIWGHREPSTEACARSCVAYLRRKLPGLIPQHARGGAPNKPYRLATATDLTDAQTHRRESG